MFVFVCVSDIKFSYKWEGQKYLRSTNEKEDQLDGKSRRISLTKFVKTGKRVFGEK